MQLLARLEQIDYALLPIGDNFTMGPRDARVAAQFLEVPYVIPIHYNTWPLIAQDPEKFKKSVELKTEGKTQVIIVPFGTTRELD